MQPLGAVTAVDRGRAGLCLPLLRVRGGGSEPGSAGTERAQSSLGILKDAVGSCLQSWVVSCTGHCSVRGDSFQRPFHGRISCAAPQAARARPGTDPRGRSCSLGNAGGAHGASSGRGSRAIRRERRLGSNRSWNYSRHSDDTVPFVPAQPLTT